MTMRKLKVLKPGKYGTRHLIAGEEFELPIREAVALVVTRKAKFADKATPRAVENTGAKVAAPPAPEPEGEPRTPHAVGAMTSMPDIDSLRLQATALGINVDGRWGAHRLQQEIEQAKDR